MSPSIEDLFAQMVREYEANGASKKLSGPKVNRSIMLFTMLEIMRRQKEIGEQIAAHIAENRALPCLAPADDPHNPLVRLTALERAWSRICKFGTLVLIPICVGTAIWLIKETVAFIQKIAGHVA